MLTEDANTTLTKIKYVLDEIENVAKTNPDLRTHFLANLHEAKGEMLALKVKSNFGLMHPLSQPSFKIGHGPRTLWKFKSCT